MLRRHFTYFITHPLISGSVVIVIGSQLGNFLNFVYNLFMSRNLSVADYGILASFSSFILLAAIPAGSFVPTIVNFAATNFAKNNLDYVRGLFLYMTKVFFVIGFLFLSVFLLFNQHIADFFNLEDKTGIIFLVGITIFIIYIGVVNGAILQAKLSFTFITAANLIGSLVKFIIGIGLVILGFGIGGAMVAFFLSFFIPYVIGFFPLRFLFSTNIKEQRIGIRELLSYGGPAAVATYALSSFISNDLMLVKHFFTPDQAGIYAGLSLVGRVIFFISAPIGSVMFPMIARKHATGENYSSIFKLALAIVFIPSVMLSFAYFLVPDFFILFFLKKSEFLEGASLLGVFGIFTALYSVLSILTYYLLSVRRTEVFIPLISGSILQVVLIWLWHDSFFQVILISLSVTGLLLSGLLLYYWKSFR